jgi:hypothetical protein
LVNTVEIRAYVPVHSGHELGHNSEFPALPLWFLANLARCFVLIRDTPPVPQMCQASDGRENRKAEPRDPASIAAAVTLLAAVAALAGYIPARRAARYDPAHVLRYE